MPTGFAHAGSFTPAGELTQISKAPAAETTSATNTVAVAIAILLFTMPPLHFAPFYQGPGFSAIANGSPQGERRVNSLSAFSRQ